MIKKEIAASIAITSACLLALTFTGCADSSKTVETATASNNANVNSSANGGVQPGAATNSAASSNNAGPELLPAGSAGASPGASASTANRTAPDPRTPKPQIGSGASDFYLFTQVRGALNADNELRDSGVIIDLREGVATLTGTVSTNEQKQKAAQLVQGVQGVKSVKNQLRVAASAQKP